MEKAKNTKRKNLNIKILLTALLIFIGAFFIILFAGGFIPDSTPSDFTEDKTSGRINLLITGLDPDGVRTDFLMIASYSTAQKRVDILTIPENTKMYVGGRYQKISAAHALRENGKTKGISGTVDALNRLTAIPLNYYIEFSIKDFAALIDEMGGVEFDITKSMKYRDRAQDLNINLKTGYQLLRGNNATHALRYTSYPEGEQKRTSTQQEFMLAFAEQKLNPKYIAMLPELSDKLGIKTNLSREDIIRYSNLLLTLSAEDITFHTVPGHQEENGVTYWIADIEAQKELIQTVFGYNPKKITIEKNN